MRGTLILLLILFFVLGSGLSRFSWKQGVGHSVCKQLDKALTNKDAYKTAFGNQENEEEALALIRALELYRMQQMDQMLHPIEGNIITTPIYGAVGMMPGIVRGYCSALPMAFEMSVISTNENKLRKESNRTIQAKHDGLIYSTLMINGVHIPLFGFILATTGIIAGLGSIKTRRSLIIAFPLLGLYGMIFLAIAERMASSVPTSFSTLLSSTFVIWLTMAMFFGLILLIASFFRSVAKRY